MEITQIDEKTDSINVSKTSTGKYSFDVKIYSKDLFANSTAISNKISEIMADLKSRFE